MTTPLSVVIPVHNEAQYLGETIESLVTAVDESGFEAEVILVDDGSTDGSAKIVRAALDERLPLTVVHQANRGRFQARRIGIESARYEMLLLLDGRVRIDRNALAFVEPRLERGERVWTSHVHVVDGGRPLGVFWRLLAELAWSEYFSHPRTTSFGVEEFDRFPKGTTCLLAPRELLVAATDAFRSAYSDMRHANDDTVLLRWIAERSRIHVSPHYASSYLARTDLQRFVRHAYHRGIVFLDGHGRPSSRFFPVAVCFYPTSAVWSLSAIRRKSLVPATLVGLSAAAATYAVLRRRTLAEVSSLAVATPVYALGHGAGMWTGLALLARDRLRRRIETPRRRPAADARPRRRRPTRSSSTPAG